MTNYIYKFRIKYSQRFDEYWVRQSWGIKCSIYILLLLIIINIYNIKWYHATYSFMEPEYIKYTVKSLGYSSTYVLSEGYYVKILESNRSFYEYLTTNYMLYIYFICLIMIFFYDWLKQKKFSNAMCSIFLSNFGLSQLFLVQLVEKNFFHLLVDIGNFVLHLITIVLIRLVFNDLPLNQIVAEMYFGGYILLDQVILIYVFFNYLLIAPIKLMYFFIIGLDMITLNRLLWENFEIFFIGLVINMFLINVFLNLIKEIREIFKNYIKIFKNFRYFVINIFVFMLSIAFIFSIYF